MRGPTFEQCLEEAYEIYVRAWYDANPLQVQAA